MTQPTQAQIEADILERLRKQWIKPDDTVDANALCWEAADEIERLTAAIRKLKGALVGDDKVVEGYGYGWRASFESTIERCAQVAETVYAPGHITGSMIAAAIRKLKDAP